MSQCWQRSVSLYNIAPLSHNELSKKHAPFCRQLWRPEKNIWRRHQMETFFALLALCTGNSPVTGEFPSQRPVTRSFDVFFDLRLNKRLSKQSWGRWFETPSRSVWRHCNKLRSTYLILSYLISSFRVSTGSESHIIKNPPLFAEMPPLSSVSDKT